MSLVSFLYQRLPSFRGVLLLSAILRVILIFYSEYHDARSVVKYTDVDYRVFSDAARFILQPSEGNVAQGPLGAWSNFGSPYTRFTYRYTPLLALLLTPNEWLHPSFGKYLFAACDIINGVLIYKLLFSNTIPKLPKSKNAANTSPPDYRAKQATLLASLHLLNPMVFAISTRGSSESVLSLFVLLTLKYALEERWDTAAMLLGLSTHWKIYPFIYGVSCVGVLGAQIQAADGDRGAFSKYFHTLVNLRTIRFGALSTATFFFLGVFCYSLWGYPFLYESYLYHLHRLDHRHNFSPYFYLTYLTYPSLIPPTNPLILPLWHKLLRSPLTSFVPQMILALGTGLLLGRKKEHLTFTWFVQTTLFVIFNKVCTSQYFLWYLIFLPLLLPRISTSPRRALVFLVVWVGTQALWLHEAYKLEFLGEDVFYSLWVRSLIYVIGNCWVLGGIMENYVVVPHEKNE